MTKNVVKKKEKKDLNLFLRRENVNDLNIPTYVSKMFAKWRIIGLFGKNKKIVFDLKIFF